MKVVCQICEKIINTEVNLKGNTGFEFSISYDDEPCINAVSKIHKSGHLCHECSQRLSQFLKYNNIR
jgi:uncharacterized protein YlaI